MAALVDPSDAAAASADGVDINSRKRQWQAFKRRFMFNGDTAINYQSGVETRAPHIERNQIRLSKELTKRLCANHAASRSGQHRMDRLLRCRRRRHGAAARTC